MKWKQSLIGLLGEARIQPNGATNRGIQIMQLL